MNSGVENGPRSQGWVAAGRPGSAWSATRGPEYRRLLAAARRSLERTGEVLAGRISVADPGNAERKAIINITGVTSPPGPSG